MPRDDDAASVRSGQSSDYSSSVGSGGGSEHLKRRHGKDDPSGEEDLLEQKRSLQEGIYSCMYTLAKGKGEDSLRFTYLKVFFEAIGLFFQMYNSTYAVWDINTSHWAYKFFRWTLPRLGVITVYSYNTYIIILYCIVAIIFTVLLGVAWLTLAMRKAEHSIWLKRGATVLQTASDLVFVVGFVPVFDFLIFPLDCRFTNKGEEYHALWSETNCLQMPHLIHMVVGGVTAVFFIMGTALMLIASCDLNPVSKAILAAPVASVRIKVLLLKATFIVLADCLDSQRKVQAGGILLSVFLICYYHLRWLPFIREHINMFWTGFWCMITFAATLVVVLTWTPKLGTDEYEDYSHQLSMGVLYGMAPMFLGGCFASYVWIRWKRRISIKFLNLPENVKLRKIYKFDHPEEVEIVARVMRKFDADGNTLPDAAALGETIIKGGMAVFPNNPALLILYANFLKEVKKDGPASRTQLQIASKSQPSMLQKYQIFATIEDSKRMRDAQDGSLDLQAYVEFKRNYRAVLRMHKAALAQQRDFWRLMMTHTVHMRSVVRAMQELEEVRQSAKQVYKRVLERYPNNGKLLKCYGKFQEEVLNDLSGAAKYYSEAARQGSNDAMAMLDFNFGKDKNEFLTSMDLNEDAVVIIDAQGNILMVSQGMSTLFGYAKNEMEGANVSMLMPQPFSQRHNGYLQRYTSTGEARILNTVREVVAMHKERYVFPISLCVTKLSGVGSDCIFLGVIRPMPTSIANVRVWVAPNGIVLCTDQMFSSVCGIAGDQLVGKHISSLATDSRALDSLLEQAKGADISAFQRGDVILSTSLVHKFRPPVPVEISVGLGGTDNQRIFVLNVARTDNASAMMLVVDNSLNLVFSTWDVSAMLGYPAKRFAKMKLDALLPSPYNTLHSKWIKDVPLSIPTCSCRANTVVHLVSSTNVHIPVKLRVSHMEDQRGGQLHVVEIDKANPQDYLDEKRITVTTMYDGIVMQVHPEESDLLGFPASRLVGQNLADWVDMFGHWRAKQGAEYLQVLMLALLDKDLEMPGCAWRVTVTPPGFDWSLLNPDTANHAAVTAARAAAKVVKHCAMQTEVVEVEGGTAVKIQLYRRDLLTGILEMDSKLSVRKADPMVGIILGHPSAMLLKQSLTKFTKLPSGTTWDSLQPRKRGQKSSLKGGMGERVISDVAPITAQHLDGGELRLMLQGVSGEPTAFGSGYKVQVTMRPDIAFHSAQQRHHHQEYLDSAYQVLEVDAKMRPNSAKSHVSHAQKMTIAEQLQREKEEAEEEAEEKALSGSGAGGGSGEEDDDEGHRSEGSISSVGSDKEEDDPARLHIKAKSQSEFIKNWVKTLSKMESQLPMGPDSANAPDAPSIVPRARRQGSGLGRMTPPPEEEEEEEEEGQGGEEEEEQPEAAEDSISGKIKRLGSGNLIKRKGSSKLSTGKAKLASSGAKGEDGDDDLVRAISALPEEAFAMKPVRTTGERGGASMLDMLPAKDPSGPGSDGGNSAPSMSDDQSDAQSGFGGPMSAAASGNDEIQLDARRGKLYKKLMKLMHGPKLLEPLNRMRVHSYIVLAIILVTHITCYVAFSVLLNGQHKHVFTVNRLAMATDRCLVVAVRAQIASFCSGLNHSWPHRTVCSLMDSTTTYQDGYRTILDEYENFHQGVYLGFDGSLSKLADSRAFNVWTNKNVNYTVYEDTNPPRQYTVSDSLFVVGNRLLAAGREVVYQIGAIYQGVKYSRAHNMLVANAPNDVFRAYTESLDYMVDYAWQQLTSLQTGLIVLMVVEALVVQVACMLYNLTLLRRLEAARYTHFLVMMGLPGPIMRQILALPITVLDDSDDESDADSDREEEAKAEVARAAKAQQPKALRMDDSGRLQENAGSGDFDMVAKSNGSMARPVMEHPLHHASTGDDDDDGPGGLTAVASSKKRRKVELAKTGLGINHKTLVPSYINIWKFMTPFVLWEIGLIIIYALSYMKLQGMQEPLASLNMASHVVYRFSLIRFTAFMVVSADTPAERATWQARLGTELRNFESEYDALMYGGTAITQEGSAFTHPVPASAFESVEFSDNFFKRQECFRYDTTTCAQEGDFYYEVTHHGLDTMVRRLLSEMTLLSLDNDTDLAYNSTRYNVMYNMGVRDLYEGLQSSAQLYVDFSIGRYDQAKLLHTIFLVITIILLLAYVFVMLRPYLSAIKGEASQVAGLLSNVPAEMDTASHVRAVMRRRAAATGGKN